MSINIGHERDIKLLVEDEWGTTPSSALELFKVTSAKIKPVFDIAEDDEIQSSGREQDHQIVAQHAEGDMRFNVRFCDCMADIFQNALGASSWTSVDIDGETDIAFNATDNALSSTSTNFISNNMTIGMIIKVSGATESENGGLAKVTALAANKATLSSGWLDLEDEAAGDAITIVGDYIRDGSTLKGFSIEDEYTNIAEFESAVGMTIRSLAINIPSKGRITGSTSFYGKTHALAQATIGTGSDTAASSNNPMITGTGVDAFYIDNASSGVGDVSLDFTFTRDLIPSEVIDSTYPDTLGMGKFRAMLKADLLFENDTFYDYMQGQNEKEYDVVIKDSSSNYYVLSYFDGKHKGVDIPETTEIVRVTADITAYEDSSRSAICQITKIAA